MGDEIADAKLLDEIKNLRIELAAKENQQRELIRDIGDLRQRLKTALITASRFLTAEITALGPDMPEAVKPKATNGGGEKRHNIFGDRTLTRMGNEGNTPIYKEVVKLIGDYLRALPEGTAVEKIAVTNYILKTWKLENNDSFGTCFGHYFNYMIKNKWVERVTRGQYRWIGKRLDPNDNYKPVLDNVVDLTK